MILAVINRVFSRAGSCRVSLCRPASAARPFPAPCALQQMQRPPVEAPFEPARQAARPSTPPEVGAHCAGGRAKRPAPPEESATDGSRSTIFATSVWLLRVATTNCVEQCPAIARFHRASVRRAPQVETLLRSRAAGHRWLGANAPSKSQEPGRRCREPPFRRSTFRAVDDALPWLSPAEARDCAQSPSSSAPAWFHRANDRCG